MIIKIKPSEIFLLMLSAAEGKISSKTLVQKRAYFLNLLLELGLSYKPHYYGPYSSDLDATIGQCKALGLVEQKTIGFGMDRGTGFEVRRFDFILTLDGQAVVDDLKKRKPAECRRVLDGLSKLSVAGDNDYVSLSIAAKTFHILKESKRPLYPDEIINEAKQLGWEISQESIDHAVSFLAKLGLLSKN
jgi:hypothetical protein